MSNDWTLALLGGGLIGLSVSLMLLWNGRVTGIAGIINGTLTPQKGDTAWRWYFVGGLLTGGLILKFVYPQTLSGVEGTGIWRVILAGLLVGFGTILGSGCTSGHGVCGISRLSPRSLVATVIFILAGIVTVTLFRRAGGL